MSAASDVPFPAGEPTRALLLAQALDACIQAERQVPGSAAYIIARQPAWARAELRRLVRLAGSLDAVATNAVMSDKFRADARARLMRRIGGEPAATVPTQGWLSTLPSRNGQHGGRRRSRRWLWRGGVGGMLAAALVAAATLTASANALPGDPLYSVKQVQEEIGVRFALDDQARALALLNQGDARLDETARLLQAGRTDEAALTTQRYDATVDRATTTFAVTVVDAPSDQPATTRIETRLTEQQAQLQALLVTAPETARADLREALVATERGRALVADSQAVGRGPEAAAASAQPAGVAEAQPTMAVVDEPTPVPSVVVAHRPPPPQVDASREAQRSADTIGVDDNAPQNVAHADEVPASPEANQPTAIVEADPAVARRTRSTDVAAVSHNKPADIQPLEIKLDDAPATTPVVADVHAEDVADRAAANAHASTPQAADPHESAPQDRATLVVGSARTQSDDNSDRARVPDQPQPQTVVAAVREVPNKPAASNDARGESPANSPTPPPVVAQTQHSGGDDNTNNAAHASKNGGSGAPSDTHGANGGSGAPNDNHAANGGSGTASDNHAASPATAARSQPTPAPTSGSSEHHQPSDTNSKGNAGNGNGGGEGPHGR